MNEEIKVKFGGDLSGLAASMRSAKEMGKDFAKDLRNEVAGIFTAGAIIGSIEKAFSKVGELKKAMASTGVSSEQIQRIDYAADAMHIGAEKANMALEKLSLKIGQAKTGSKEAEASFKKWGIAFSGGTSEVIDQIADRMKATSDESIRSAMAFDLMGKSGKDIIQLLEQGAEGLKKMGAGASVISESEMKAIEDAHAQINALNNTIIKMTGSLISFFAFLSKSAGWLSMGYNPLEQQGYENREAAESWIRAGRARAKQAADAEGGLPEIASDKKAREDSDTKEKIDKQISEFKDANAPVWKRIEKAEEHVAFLKKAIALEDDDSLLKSEYRLDLLKSESQLEKDRGEYQKSIEKTKAEGQRAYINGQEKSLNLEKMRYDLARQESDRLRPTVADIAAAGRRAGGIATTRGYRSFASYNQQQAIAVENLEAQARNAYLVGNEGLGDALKHRAESIRQGIAGTSSQERNPYEKMEGSLVKIEDTLAIKGIVIKDDE